MQSLGQSVANVFNSGDPRYKVAYWAYAVENHANEDGHYHLSL